MSRQEVIDLMKSSKSEWEWDSNCDMIKSVCGGYLPFWYEAIILSGLAAEVAASWNKHQ